MGPIASLTGQRVLISGASGFLGRHVLAKGLGFGAELHGLSRTERPRGSVRWWQADLLDRRAIKDVVCQVNPDGVLHLAAAGVAHGGASSVDVLRTNIEGLATLLDAAREVRAVQQVVVAGSGFEYASQNRALREDDHISPTSVYGVSKAAATQLARILAQHVSITVLRLFSLYGPGEQQPRIVPYVIARARQGLPVVLTAGDQVRDYAYVGDVAEGFWRTLAVAPAAPCLRVWNLASGRQTTLRSFIELLGQLLEERGVRPDLRFGARPYRSDEPMIYAAEIGQMRKQLGWSPTTSLRDGLAQTLDQDTLT
jgi:nucleoside-diphosphate-sugar epimerase